MEVRSIQEYISLIEKLKTNYTYSVPILGNSALGNQIYEPQFIFRGHSNHQKYLLLPGLFRQKDVSAGHSVSEYSQMEYNILSDFISESCRFAKDVPQGDIAAWLEIAQHFGVPTRLLDFTENPLVALYFACSASQNMDASVWIINQPVYNGLFFGEPPLIQAARSQQVVSKIVMDEIVYQDYSPHDTNMDYIQFPWIYKPIYREERMNSQASIFMLWGANRSILTDFMPPNFYISDADLIFNRNTGVIGNILIPANVKRSLIEQLDSCGINEKSIYPGLDGVGRYIRTKYSIKM